MSGANPEEKPPRRPRYRGANPRRFDEKYKELQPELYANDIEKVIAGGKTPAGSHRPIMVDEILEILTPKAGEIAVDCTLGYGGHAGRLLEAIQPGGRLIALDLDPIEGPKAEARLRGMGFPEESVQVWHRNFAGLIGVIASECPEGADMILVDLGLSSMQIDDPKRGFTYKIDARLDMRMDPTKGRSAAEFLADVDEVTLAHILEQNGDEPRALAIASAAVRSRGRSPLTTTLALASLVKSVYARGTEDEASDAVRRVFQAIRIAVNEEFAALDSLLRSLPRCLRPGGRVSILTFHSGEDRRVKTAFKQGLQDAVYSTISHDVVRASHEERRANPRSTSAKLRFAIRSTAR